VRASEREREVGLGGELICRRRSLGIDVGMTDEYGRAALHFAAFMGKVCVCVCHTYEKTQCQRSN
jgi:hypothetical protein